MNSNKMFGEKIEKNIRYSKGTDTYYVQFTFSPTNDAHLRGFPTLEDARKYRDAINAEKLKYKLEKDLAIIRKREIQEIKDTVPFPYTAFEAAHLLEEEIDTYFVDNFDSVISETCSKKEADCIIHFFKNNYTLERLGNKYGISRERVRQIIAVGLKKFAHHVRTYEARRQAEADLADRRSFREQLIEEYKKNGVITSEMNYEFGELIIGTYQQDSSIEDLGLSVRSYNSLRRGGIKTINDLIAHTERELLQIRTMGKKSIREIRHKLEEIGLDLATE